MKFIGIDVHQERLTVATINEQLEISFINHMTTNELMEYISNSEKVNVIAIDAPYKLNAGLMNNEAYRLTLNPKLKGHYNKKVSEYELSRRGLNPFSTPEHLEEVSGWKGWMKTGFDLYARLNETFGYKELNENRTIDDQAPYFIEVFPHACFSVLLGQLPSKKQTNEGLKERIDILTSCGFTGLERLLSDMGKKEKTDKLDALVAAYTAYLCSKEKVTFVGDVKEGQIALPTTDLKDSYKRIVKS